MMIHKINDRAQRVCACAVIMLLVATGQIHAAETGTRTVESPPIHLAVRVLPFVKQIERTGGTLKLTQVSIAAPAQLANEAAALRRMLTEQAIPVADDGVPIKLRLAALDVPVRASRYQTQIVDQAYALTIQPDGVEITAPSAAGVFYGVQTLRQLIEQAEAPLVKVVDWPDLAVRMVMVDSSRQNETGDYYRQMIDFLAQYKVNALHWHLTDDEILSLYQEDYPQLMHPHAWRADQIKEIIAYAAERHMTVMPEIESLGHARIFAKHPDHKDFLHQTTFDKPSKGWAGTDVPGYTNVLCPASKPAMTYLDKMYTRAAEIFETPYVHAGLDEVENTTCARCEAAFGKLPFAEWFARHLMACHDLLAKLDRKTAIWGDMLLHHRDAVKGLPRASLMIYDWHYRREVDPESAQFFVDQGFEVMGCPALVCHPRMILFDDENLDNIAAFAKVARDLDLRGLDTTIWTPTRYMSNVLWPGVAFAAVQSWSGSQFDADAFYRSFARDFFGQDDSDAFGEIWRDVIGMRWWLYEFEPACWMDEASLADAQKLAAKSSAKVQALRERLLRRAEEMAKLAPQVKRNRVVWDVIREAILIRAYTMEHLLAAPQVKTEAGWNLELVRQLDQGCQQSLKWIEADWARTRFADDANQDGAYLARQNLIYRFRQMHAFHQQILSPGS